MQLRIRPVVAVFVLAAFAVLVVAVSTAVLLWKLPLGAPALLAGRTVALGQAIQVQEISLRITPASQALLVLRAQLGRAAQPAR